MNVVVVNPSSTKTQKAMLKAYLPKEASPDIVVDMADLKVSYDIEKGLYFVYGEYDLAPGEMVKRSVHMKDIWVVAESQLESIISRALELVKDLEGTEYFDRASMLKKRMDSNRDSILVKQREAADALPEPHIAAYRENVETFGKMKEDLVELENMLLRAKPASGVAIKRVFIKASWWIILGIIGFLLLLSFVFFFVWQKQASSVAETEEHTDKESTSEDTKKEDISP
jgi:hypothetical protein